MPPFSPGSIENLARDLAQTQQSIQSRLLELRLRRLKIAQVIASEEGKRIGVTGRNRLGGTNVRPGVLIRDTTSKIPPESIAELRNIQAEELVLGEALGTRTSRSRGTGFRRRRFVGGDVREELEFRRRFGAQREADVLKRLGPVERERILKSTITGNPLLRRARI